MDIGRRASWGAACLPLLAAGLGGCAAVSSQSFETGQGASGDGLVYYAPRQAIAVTITLDKDGLGVPTVTAGTAEPDLKHPFLLKFNSNLFAGNHAVIGVSASGLLSAADASATSSAGDIAKALGTAAGSVAAAGFVGKAVPSCEKSRAYVALIHPGDDGNPTELCNFKIEVKPAPGPLPKNSGQITGRPATSDGVFYRQQLPYQVTVTAPGGAATTFLAFSPDKSPILYYPVSKGFFANTDTSLTLTDGMITRIDQKTDSELVGFVGMPAAFISAYFAAIGNIFGDRNKIEEDRKTMADDRANRAAAEAKLKACQQTVLANPLEGKAGADLTAAMAAIKGACS